MVFCVYSEIQFVASGGFHRDKMLTWETNWGGNEEGRGGDPERTGGWRRGSVMPMRRGCRRRVCLGNGGRLSRMPCLGGGGKTGVVRAPLVGASYGEDRKVGEEGHDLRVSGVDIWCCRSMRMMEDDE